MGLRKQTFSPGKFLGLFFNPFYFDRISLYSGISNNSKYIRGTVLDFGCGSKPYKNLFVFDKYVGLDIKNKHHVKHKNEVDFYYDGNRFPFESGCFDSVFSSQSFQYVGNPKKILKEMRRTMKKDGFLLMTFPMISDVTERPYDKYRYTEYSIREILKECGFKIIKITPLENNIAHICSHLINAHIYRKTMKGRNIFRIILTLFISSIVNVLGLFFGLFFKKDNDTYLENLVVAQKI